MPRYQAVNVISSRSHDMKILLREPDEDRNRVRDDMKRMARQLEAATAARIPLVYAVTRAEAPVVKIGFSRHLAGRRGGRLIRMPGCTLVALMAGGYAEEHAVHERLAAHRVHMDFPGYGGSEHFWINDDVLAWINETRDVIGLDPLRLDQLLPE